MEKWDWEDLFDFGSWGWWIVVPIALLFLVWGW